MLDATYPRGHFAGSNGDFSNFLNGLHAKILVDVPSLVRIAVALFDNTTGVLKTFASSSKIEDPIGVYEAPLNQLPSLERVIISRNVRVVDDIANADWGVSRHSTALLDIGIKSSVTFPVFVDGLFRGFVFFNSNETGSLRDYVDAHLFFLYQAIKGNLEKHLQSVGLLTGVISTFRNFAKIKSEETSEHIQRVGYYSRMIAQNLAATHDIDQEFVESVFLYAPLHDIGKVGTPDAVLSKPGMLDCEEVLIMRKHVEIGADLIESMAEDFHLKGLMGLELLNNIVLHHHENWDGSGYPFGLKGEDIPLEARIVAVADVFDALTSVRPYKPAWSIEDALNYIRCNRGAKFDPDCVDAFLKEIEKINSVYQRFVA